LILVNLNHIAPVPPYQVSIEDLQQVLANCQAMFEDYLEEDLTQLLVDWEAALSYSALSGTMIAEDWYIRALICVCLRGLRGEECPNIVIFNL